MKRKNENKNDKIKILVICFLVYVCLSWIFEASTYQSGQFVKLGWFRAGLFDVVSLIFSGFTYNIETILYILAVGGMYGVLSKAESYKRVVHKLSDIVHKHGEIMFFVVTLLVGLFTAVSYDVMLLFILVPFIVSIFLKGGYDKLTAMSAGFGGLFLGYLGQLTGTYGNHYIYEYFKVDAISNIGIKVALFVVAVVLFNVFGILHLRKNKNVELEEKADMFEVGELVKANKKRDEIMTWPTVVVAIMVLVIMVIGYLPWKDVFGITFFDKLHTAVMNFSIGSIKLMETIIGTEITALGTWADFFPMVFMMFILLVVVAFTNRLSLNTIFDSFGDGIKRISKVAFIYGLAFTLLYFATAYPWTTGIVNAFIKTDSYNLIFILLAIIAAVLAIIFCGDPLYSGYYYAGQYLSVIFTVNLGISAIIWRVGTAIGLLVGPTSFLLLSALVYSDIPYTKWLKYIWKFALAFFIATVLILGIVVM